MAEIVKLTPEDIETSLRMAKLLLNTVSAVPVHLQLTAVQMLFEWQVNTCWKPEQRLRALDIRMRSIRENVEEQRDADDRADEGAGMTDPSALPDRIAERQLLEYLDATPTGTGGVWEPHLCEAVRRLQFDPRHLISMTYEGPDGSWLTTITDAGRAALSSQGHRP